MKPVKQLWTYLRERKIFWLAPIILVMIIIGVLLLQAQSSGVAPLFYNVF